jgi:hypothetical protein
LAVQSQIAANNFALGLAGLNTSQNLAYIGGQNAVDILKQQGQNNVDAINAQKSMSGGDWISSITGGINALTGGPSATNPGASLLSTFGGSGGAPQTTPVSGGSSGGGGSGANLQSLASIASVLALFLA